MTDLLATFAHGLKAAGDGWTSKCPAHDDRRNSLAIGRGADGRWLLHCHAGCSLETILAAVQLTSADLFADETRPSHALEIVATYHYKDEDGGLLYDVVRFAPKTFRPRNPAGEWTIKTIRRVLYRLPELRGRNTVFLVEGERDVDRLWRVQLPATCNVGGAGKWRDEYTTQLTTAGCHRVVVLPDNDPAGEAHGRQVARSCHDGGLAVKLLPLPDLPAKGDVSDYLAQHSAADLLALVKDAPLFNPATRVTARPALTFTSLADFLDEPDDAIDWLVEDRIPMGGVVLLAAPPKAGKSTLARELGVCVATGRPFLGWRTTQGLVWFLIFQDKRKEVRRHFARLGAPREAPIKVFIDQPPADLLAELETLAAIEKPVLIVVDMLAHALRVKDFNDYAQITSAFAPLLQLSRTTGAALLPLHHGSAHQQREGLDAVLASTAISGSVDNVLLLKRVDKQRVLSSVQRIGPDLEPVVLVLSETGRLEQAGTKRDVDSAELSRLMLAKLQSASQPLPENVIHDSLEGRKQDKVRVLRVLLGTRQVERSGGGRRGNPYVYRFVETGSRPLDTGSQPAGNAAIGGNQKNQPDLGLFRAESPAENTGSCSLPVNREPESLSDSQYVDLDNDLRPTTSGEPGPSATPSILVPAGSENAQPEPEKHADHPDKHWSDTGSRDRKVVNAADEPDFDGVF